MNNQKKGAAPATRALHDKILKELTDEYLEKERHDFANIKKYLVYELGGEDITDRDGTVLYKAESIKPRKSGDFPDTVNPYLWQAGKNYDFAGIAKVAEGYYVALGIDSSETGFIKTRSGWIIVDTGNYLENAALARRLAEIASGEIIEGNIKAVIISHTHPDHYGGIAAFVKEGDDVPVYAPAGFEKSLIDENLSAGVPMARRLVYQGGLKLPSGEKDSIGVGIMPGILRGHRLSFRFPDILLEEDRTINIDGVELDFFLTPETETIAHLGVYSRTHRVLFLADNAMGTLHNVYTPRGARVRDANYWGEVFYRLYTAYGDEIHAVWQGHGIPLIEEETNENIKTYLLDHAAAYKYTNDQALLLANKGYSRDRIGSEFKVPDQISRQWYVRPHYGEYNFNARGIYTKYLGFYDGNPVHQNPLERTERAAKLVEYIGSEELILEKAQKDYEKGQFQWVAEITNELIWLNPENTDARYLCADALEQLGYQSENGIQRNSYLSGAADLRNPESSASQGALYMDNRSIMPYTSPELLLDYLGINFDGEKAVNEKENFVLYITEAGKKDSEYHRVSIYKGTVLHAKIRKEDIKKTEPVISLKKAELYALAVKKYRPDKEALTAEAYRVLSLIEDYVVDTSRYANFPLVEPLKES